MRKNMLQSVLGAIGQIRGREGTTALLMFLYSFLAMTSHNIIKPVTRSKFITDLGAENLPYVQLVAGLLIGVIMAGYAWLVSRLPRRWSIPVTQAGIAGVLVTFWFLFRTGEEWVSALFYLFGLILGILLISQFWTFANVIYDPRQAKRLFGFIGGGASLGGALGSGLTRLLAKEVGAENLLLLSAATMLLCLVIVSFVVTRESQTADLALAVGSEVKGVGWKRAFELLRQSRHLRLIALVISFAAIGAAFVEQQLNMATEATKGQANTDEITAFLATVAFWTSLFGFLIQIAVTSRIHRYLGIGFALVLLPVSLGTTGLIILFYATLWAPAVARVLDQSLRYTVDKTTREILYMPLPADSKLEAKPFVDVTVDRFAKGIGAVLLLFLISSWGLGLNWQQLSYVTVLMTGLWIFMALKAKRAYQEAFRHSIETGEIKPSEIRLAFADLSTVETLIQELASPEEGRVLYAIDLLESLDKKNLVTPLLLHHESPAVRLRVLELMAGAQPEISSRWLPAVQTMLGDESPEVRAAAVAAVARMRGQQSAELVRPLLHDDYPRIAMTSAMILAGSSLEEDVRAAENMLTGLVADSRDSAARLKKEFAVAIRYTSEPHFRRLLIPLLHDSTPDVAAEAMHSVRQLGPADFIFVPTLISLLRDRRLKSSAREALVEHGEPALPILRHFMLDQDEDIWVRRHIPATIALIPCQRAVEALIEALGDPDGFLRFKAIAALERLRRNRSELKFPAEPIEADALRECERLLTRHSIAAHLRAERRMPEDALLARALAEKVQRALDRIYRLLGLVYPWEDIAAARWAIEHDGTRGRAGALEYLDNTLKGELRRKLLPVIEEATASDSASRHAAVWRRPGGAEAAILRLIHDKDPVLSASAIYFIWQQRLSGFAGELERVLATRDVRDWCVFEAVSWVLAAFRLHEDKRRLLWREPLPAVELVERLRALPMFASVTVDELFRIARAGQQLRYEERSLLFQENAIPEYLQFLLEGRVSRLAKGKESVEVKPPAALGFREVLEARPIAEFIRAIGTVVCLALNSDDYWTMLSDNTDLVRGLFRMLCDCGSGTSGSPVITGRGRAPSPAGQAPLKPIDKVLSLQQIALFSHLSAEEALNLASIAEEICFAPGSMLFSETDHPALYVLLSGSLALESADHDPPLAAGPGDAIGVCETLAGVSLGRRARATAFGTALRIDREDLFDLLSQRPVLLQELFSALFRSQAL
ncbi:MAG: HEAT repeat domain-containing protein [Acidobacteria bacterium]|nr:HEAT repeat domain-containing protein [Acidobacteriota bacterium]